MPGPPTSGRRRAAVRGAPAAATLRGYRGGYLPAERRHRGGAAQRRRAGRRYQRAGTGHRHRRAGGGDPLRLSGSIASTWQQMGRAGRTTGCAGHARRHRRRALTST